VVFLTGHYGANWEDLETLIALVQPHVGTRLHGLPDFEVNRLGFTGDGKNHRDHAGRAETSQLWAVEPELVDLSRLPPPDAPGPHFAMGPTAREADRRIGERMIEAQAEALAEIARTLLADCARLRPEHRLLTFEAVERLWDEVVHPAIKSFKTMQDDCVGNRSLPPESRWYPNWRVPDRG
jgi:creatinine amidohydrolase